MTTCIPASNTLFFLPQKGGMGFFFKSFRAASLWQYLALYICFPSEGFFVFQKKQKKNHSSKLKRRTSSPSFCSCVAHSFDCCLSIFFDVICVKLKKKKMTYLVCDPDTPLHHLKERGCIAALLHRADVDLLTQGNDPVNRKTVVGCFLCGVVISPCKKKK